MKFFKYLFYFILFLIIVVFCAVKFLSEKRPQGTKGAAADAMAEKVLRAVNKDAFDTITYVQWEFFRPGQKYFWNKKDNVAIIEFEQYKVIMTLDDQMAICYKDGLLLDGAEHDKAKNKAWSNWCNDSFWLLAPFKLFDPGTSREIVNTKEGEALFIQYESGGVTPGDGFLWMVDDNYRPTGWKMWTKILPIQGLYNSWEDWQDYNGILLASGHSFYGKKVSMKNIKTGMSFSYFGYDKDPFLQE